MALNQQMNTLSFYFHLENICLKISQYFLELFKHIDVGLYVFLHQR